MKLNKKVIESAALFAFAGLLTITAVTSSGKTVAEAETPLACIKAAEETVGVNTSLEKEGIAGVTATLYKYQEAAAEANVVVKAVDADVVATSEEVEKTLEEKEVKETTVEEATVVEAEVEVDEKEAALKKDWSDKLMAKVDEFLYVRESGDEDAAVVGKLYKGDRALIVKAGKVWTKIESGRVEGYVKNEFCVTADDALAYAAKTCDMIATSQIDGLRIREKQSMDADVVGKIATGDKLKVKKDAETEEGWVAVVYESKTCYVSEEYVKVAYDTGKAISKEEEQAEIAAEEAKKEAEKRNSESSSSKSSNDSKSSKSSSSSKQSKGADRKNGSSVAAATNDVTLLAALIQCEVGGCSYDCQLAVGAVVVNRVKSRSYPNSVSKVIYQRGQFGPARSGSLARRIKKGPKSSCIKAAKAALSGVDNTNGAKYFKLAKSGHKGVVYGPVVFY